MSDTTKIEWCDSTFNPWIGCTKVGPGCDHCYAEVSTPSRTLGVVWGPKAERRRTSPGNWAMPSRWEREHEAFFAQHGRRRRVFCASLADVFDNQVDPQWRVDLFELIQSTPHLDWLLVTKRIGNAHVMIGESLIHLAVQQGRGPTELMAAWPWANVWLGASIVTREEMLRDGPKLRQVPARVRFWSAEPLLEDLGTIPRAAMPDWVIVGGESGTKARPMHPDWPRFLRDQCAAAGVPFLFKQWGEWAPGSGDFGQGRFETAAIERTGTIVVPGGFTTTDYPKGAESRDGWAMVHRAGKKAAGRLLDGIEHNGFPGGTAA